MKKYRIATIQGDGIGQEVVPEGIRVIDAAGRKAGIRFEWQHFPWSCAYYNETGRMMPEDGLDLIRHQDAIFLGAVGFPGVPDHISLWGLLIPIRRVFEQYANVRPVSLMPGNPISITEPGSTAISISLSFARIPKENTRLSVDECLRAPTSRLRCNNQCSRAAASTGFCGYAFEISL